MVACLWEEGEILRERKNQHYVMMALVVQQATATTGMAASKDTSKMFKEFIDRLSED